MSADVLPTFQKLYIPKKNKAWTGCTS